MEQKQSWKPRTSCWVLSLSTNLEDWKYFIQYFYDGITVVDSLSHVF